MSSEGSDGEDVAAVSAVPSAFGWTDKHRAAHENICIDAQQPLSSPEEGAAGVVVVETQALATVEPEEEKGEGDSGALAVAEAEPAAPPMPMIENVELPSAPEEFEALAERVVKELTSDSCDDPCYYARVLATCVRQVDSLPEESKARVPSLVKDGTVALLQHNSLEGEVQQVVHALVQEVLQYCVRMIPRDCVPLAQLMAECIDIKQALYRDQDDDAPEDDDGDTTGWRMSLDFADHVDVLKTAWDKSRSWTTGQIIEVNPANQKVKVQYDGGYEGDDDWVDRFSPDLAPHRTKSVRAAKELEAWKASLVVGARCDLQDYSSRAWFPGRVSGRLEAGEYQPPSNYYNQADTSAHIKVTCQGKDGDVESEWLSVNSYRLARYGTRAEVAGAEFEDFDDGDDPEDPEVYACEHGKAYGNASLVAAVNCIGKAGGFSAMLQRLCVNGAPSSAADSVHEDTSAEPGAQPEPEPEPERAQIKPAAPVEVIESFAQVLVNSRMVFNRHFGAQYMLKFNEAVRTNIFYMTEEHVRGLSFQVMENLISPRDGLIPKMMERQFSSAESGQACELFSLTVALKCYRCDLMERKMFGFKTISDVQDGVRFGKAAWLTSNYLAKWLVDERVAEDIFAGSSVCIPVVERAADLLQFLARLKMLDSSILRAAWRCSLSNDEASRLAIYQLLKDLATSLPEQELVFIFEEVDAIPPADLQEATMLFIVDLAKSSIYRAPNLALRSLDLLWNWMVDSSQAPPALARLSETKLVELVSVFQMKEQRLPLMQKCIECVAQSDSVPQCLQVCWKIADSFPPKRSWTEHQTKTTAVEAVQKSHDLLGAFFGDFSRYKNRASEHYRLKKDDVADDDVVLCSRMPHLKQIDLRLNFLRFILHNSSLVLSLEQLQQLWDMSAADATATDAEKEIMYTWMKDETSMMDADGIKHVFESKMVQMSPHWLSQLSKNGFLCFTRFFTLSNESQQGLISVDAMDATTGGEFAPFQVLQMPKTLTGYEAFWSILLHASNEDVVRECTNFLTDLCENLAPELTNEIGNIRNQCLETCTGHMRRLLAEKDTERTGRCISLLETLLSRAETLSTFGLTSHRACLRSDVLAVLLRGLQTNWPAQHFQSSLSVWELRVWIGTRMNINPDQLCLIRKGVEIPFASNSKTLAEAGVVTGDVIVVTKRPPPPKPKAMLVDTAGHMVPAFKEIVLSWFNTYGENGTMTRQQCASFIRATRKDTCQWDDPRVTAIFKQFDTTEDDVLSERDFISIYHSKARTHQGQRVVWDNLQAHGWGHDLKRKAKVYKHPTLEEQHAKRILLPRYLLATGPEYFDLLVQLLDLGGRTMERVWALLGSLPTQQPVLDGLHSLSSISDDGEGWEKLLDPNSTFRLLYALEVVAAQIQGGALPEPDCLAWRETFLAKRGLQHIHKLLSTKAGSALASQLHTQCVATLLEIEEDFFHSSLPAESVPQPESEPEPEPEPEPEDDGDTVDDAALAAQRQHVQLLLEKAIATIDLDALQTTVMTLIVKITAAKVTQTGAVCVQNALKLWIAVVISNPLALLESFFQLQHATSTVLNTLLCSSPAVRDSISKAVYRLCALNAPARVRFMHLLLKNVPRAQPDTSAPPTNADEYFELLCKLVQETPDGEVLEFELPAKLSDLLAQLQTYPFAEESALKPDALMVGLIRLSRAILDKVDVAKYCSEHDVCPLLSSLFNAGLFDRRQPQFVSNASRTAAYGLLQSFVADDAGRMMFMWQQMAQLQTHFKPVEVFNYNPSADVKSETGLVGLRNLGCTCYMNSIMQQFFSVAHLRYGILSARQHIVDEEKKQDQPQDKDSAVTDPSKMLANTEIAQLQRIFSYLEASERQDHVPLGLCETMSLELNVQMDANEFLMNLLDRVEKQLKGTPQEKLVDRVFSCTMASQLRSKSENFFRQSEAKELVLEVDVQNRKDIHESLEKMVAWENLDEYRLDPRPGEEVGVQCNDAQKRVCLHGLPNTMIVHLKRFVLDYDTWQTVKKNGHFEFPQTLNVEPYTAEGLKRRDDAESTQAQAAGPQSDDTVGTSGAAAPTVGESLSRQGSANSASSAHSGEQEVPVGVDGETEEGIPPPVRPLSFYEYTLAGVVVHVGTADAGHYYSLIRQRDTGKWLRFDDSIVSPFDPAGLPEECFGGWDEQVTVNAYGFESRTKRERVKSAYMLIYDRVWREAAESEGADDDDAVESPDASDDIDASCAIRRELSESLHQEVSEDNSTLAFDQRVFCSQLFSFATSLVQGLATATDGQGQQPGLEQIKEATQFACCTVARAENNEVLPSLVDVLCRLYENSPDACKWLLDGYQEDKMEGLCELLVLCPCIPVRKSMAKLLLTALRIVDTDENDLWSVPEQPTAEQIEAAGTQQRPRSVTFFLQMYELMPTVAKTWTRFEQYWVVWAEWVQQRERNALWLGGTIGLSHFIEFFLSGQVGKANIKPDFGPLVSCVCTCATVALKASSDAQRLCEKDAVMIRRQGFYGKALKENHAPTQLTALACTLARGDPGMTALLISTVQGGIDLLDYQDIPPYLELLAELVLIDDELQQYRLRRLFNEEAVGLLCSIEKYKLNKSQQPSRYAYDVLKAIIDAASAHSSKALPFAAFLDGLSAPPRIATSFPQAGHHQEVQGLFLDWCKQFVVNYEAQRAIEKDMPGKACCEATRAKLQSLVDRRQQRQAQLQAAVGQDSPTTSTQQIMFSEEHDGVQLQVIETTCAKETTAEAFLSVVASNLADDDARLTIAGLRNTTGSGGVAELPNFSLKSLSQTSHSLPGSAARVVILGPIYKLDPAQVWGGVAIQWSCHRTGWPRSPAPAPSPPVPTASNSTTMPDIYDTCIPVGEATQVDGDIRLTPREQVDAD